MAPPGGCAVSLFDHVALFVWILFCFVSEMASYNIAQVILELAM